MMRVNRLPETDDVIAQLKNHLIPDLGSINIDTIGPDDLDEEGEEILRRMRVEGQPAHGITLRNTKWGRDWCAFRTEENN